MLRHPHTLALAAVLGLTLVAPARAEDRSPAAREADGALHFADRAGRRLLGLLDRARSNRSPRQVACVDGKLTQINSFGRTLADRRARLLAAEGRGDAATVRHERRVIRTMHARLRELEREGRACVFPGAAARGSHTVVEVIIDEDVPDVDPSRFGDAGGRSRW